MVVAAGAAERQAQERLAERVELLVDDVHLHLDRVVLGEHLRPDDEEAGRDEPVGPLGVGAAGEQVAGDLLADELRRTACRR